VRKRVVEVEGIPTWVRERPGDGTPVIFWHGNPTDADDWLPFMERLERQSFAADLPGFGRSAAPGKDLFDYSIDAYGRWAEALVLKLGVERYSLVVHDWGSIGLLAALAHPERVERIVAFNCVPFGVSYEWHPIARIWRRRLAGEIAIRVSRGPMVDLGLRQSRPRFQPMPAEFVSRVKRSLRREETKAAILALYRSADEAKLDEVGLNLESLEAPALLLWAGRDPYIGSEYGRRLAKRLSGAALEEIEDAGHWSWIDRPELIDRVVRFLS